tara:strand:- start:53830 stop:54000 length:171 start_codon:yes stop_codon:yes gene_type:complete
VAANARNARFFPDERQKRAFLPFLPPTEEPFFEEGSFELRPGFAASSSGRDCHFKR